MRRWSIEPSFRIVNGFAEVENQEQLDAALNGAVPIKCVGNGVFEVRDSSHVTAYGSSQVRAGKYVAVTKQSSSASISGGVVIDIPKIATPSEWLDFYVVEDMDGVVTLFKAVDAEFKSNRGFSYRPGTIPQAPDWDGGQYECGGGLHFCPSPIHALWFYTGATKFVACPVRVADIVVHTDPTYPTKIKAQGCCAPVWECDVHGNPINSSR